TGVQTCALPICALLFAALKARIQRNTLLEQFEIEKEYAFDSTRKMMSVIVKDANGKRFAITKGAPDVLVEKCESILWDGKQRLMNKNLNTSVMNAVNDLAAQELRTIAIAMKPIHSGVLTEK